MKRRDVTLSRRAWVDDDGDWWPDPGQSIQVHEHDLGSQPTGLLDKNGNELFAQDIPNPIGFTAKIEDE